MVVIVAGNLRLQADLVDGEADRRVVAPVPPLAEPEARELRRPFPPGRPAASPRPGEDGDEVVPGDRHLRPRRRP